MAEDYSALGAIQQEAFGNRLRIGQTRDRAGLLSRITAAYLPSEQLGPEVQTAPSMAGATRVQDLELQYDEAFNLRKRIDRATGLANHEVDETYEYDAVNRLEYWTVVAGGVRSRFRYRFDDYGNLRQREVTEGPGMSWNFTFGGARPHAIESSSIGEASPITYLHDSHGRRWRDGTRDITFTDLDLPRQIMPSAGGPAIADFQYDAFGSRIRKVASGAETLTLVGCTSV